MKSLTTFLCFVAVISAFAQETKIRFFSHPGFDYIHHSDSGTGSPYFRGGPLVLFATSQINENISAGAELNAHYMANTGAEVEIERIFVKYYLNDNLSFRVGRMYTPIGYWNLNYNFGLILQPNISRPMSMNPTHDGGYALTRDAGVQLEGENISKARLFYKFLIGNGIGKNGGLLGGDERLGRTVCFTGQLGAEPIDGLKILASGQFNKLYKGAVNQYDSIMPEGMLYYTGTFSTVYLNPEKKFEFIGEYLNTTFAYETLGNYNVNSFILYAGYKITDKVIPYLFSEATIFSNNNPYFPTVNYYTSRGYQNIRKYDLGIRFKLNPNFVLKLEGGLSFEDNYGTAINAKSQIAFGF